MDGTYVALESNDQGWLWSEQLQLFLGIHDQQLRFFTPEGMLVPTPEESAQAAVQKAEMATQQAEMATQQAEMATQQAEMATQQAEMATQQVEMATQQAEMATQQAETAIQQAEAERLRSNTLATKLRELGIDPDNL